MTPQLSRSVVLTLYCFFRQAERSVHYALSCPKQWSHFIAYYDEKKRKRIAELVEMLRRSGATQDVTPPWTAQYGNTVLEILSALGRMVTNRRKTTWSFSVREMSFLSASLEQLLKVLAFPEPPESQWLIDLLMDLYLCNWMIGRKLIGIPELRAAENIEHFNQNESIQHWTLEELESSWLGGEHKQAVRGQPAAHAGVTPRHSP